MMQHSIQLNRMKFHAFHGVLKQERKVGNSFIIDLSIHLDLSKAIESDLLTDTVSYAEIYEIIKNEMETPSNLLEHVAGRIISGIRSRFPQIKGIDIRLSKMNPPITGDIESAAVVLSERF